MKMTKAPVYYALAQAQFNPVAAMAKYVDEIQDILRRRVYLFEPQEITQLQFVAAAGQAPTNPELMKVTNWLISKLIGPLVLFWLILSAYHSNSFMKLGMSSCQSWCRDCKLFIKWFCWIHIARLGLRYLDGSDSPAKMSRFPQYLADGLQRRILRCKAALRDERVCF